jgi:lipopolysaccharide transport system permease protein
MSTDSASRDALGQRRPTVISAARTPWSDEARELWGYREVLVFLTWRDLKVRYRQTALGVSWVLLGPLLNTGVFSLLFGFLLRAPSGNVPYPVLVLSGLVPWTFFAGSVGRCSASLVAQSQLVTKVYFPRVLIPAAVVLSTAVDLLIGLLLLAASLVFFGVAPGGLWYLLPVALLSLIANTAGIGMLVAALNARYRDVGHAVPVFLQLAMYLTPVVYAPSLLGRRLALVYLLNPMAGSVDALRCAVLGASAVATPLPFWALGASLALSALVFATGAEYFRRTERGLADVI